MDSGVAQQADRGYGRLSRTSLKRAAQPDHLGADAASMPARKANPKRVVFAEGEEEVVLRAAIQFRDFGYGTPVLVGRDPGGARQARRARRRRSAGRSRSRTRPHLAARAARWSTISTQRLQRRGYSERDVRADGQPGPQHLRLAAGRAGRGRCDDHRRHPPLRADDARGAPRARSEAGRRCRSASTCWSARTTPCSSPTRRSTSGPAPRSWRTSPSETAGGRAAAGA